jgi:hypothetical protein
MAQSRSKPYIFAEQFRSSPIVTLRHVTYLVGFFLATIQVAGSIPGVTFGISERDCFLLTLQSDGGYEFAHEEKKKKGKVCVGSVSLLLWQWATSSLLGGCDSLINWTFGVKG